MRFYQRILLSLFVCMPWLLLLTCTDFQRLWLPSRNHRASSTISSPLPVRNENLTRAAALRVTRLEKRPLLVRFGWYVDGTSPVHFGYGGTSAMTIFSPHGFEETTGNHWDLLWTMVPQWENMAKTGNHHYKPKPWQVHNHCLGLKNNEGMAGTKESQWKHVWQMQLRYGEEEFGFMPETLVLPDDETKIKERLRSSPQPWILKPSIGKQALGVKIVTNRKQLPSFRQKENAGKRFVLQRYVTDPLLVLGRKFHMRLYLVLTSLSPLRVLAHDEGLVLFAVHNYSLDAGTFEDMKVHLTNSAVADRNKAQGSLNGWLLSTLWKHLTLMIGHSAVQSMQRNIDDAFVKLALSAQLENGGFEQRRSGGCFDLLGVDVLVDSKHRVHVMEVNVGPEVVSQDPSTHEANELAHKAVLTDLVPLAAMTDSPENVKKSFEEKLLQFMDEHKQSLCAPNAFVLETANCLTTQDVEDLWRLHRETVLLGHFRRLYPAPGTSSKYTQYFHAGLDPRNYWALKWVDDYYSVT
eukprot:scpid64433/ scgid2094/ Tubulin polyglutamylase TTLL4; Tubulin--tyrosine ligase-like protein 4